MSGRHENVAAVDTVVEVVAEASDPASGKSVGQVEGPLVHQYPAWHDDEYEQAPPVRVGGSSQGDIGLAGARDGLDDAAAAATKPTGERFELPSVERLVDAVHAVDMCRGSAGYFTGQLRDLAVGAVDVRELTPQCALVDEVVVPVGGRQRFKYSQPDRDSVPRAVDREIDGTTSFL